MAEMIATVKVDLLNDQPFLDLIQRAMDLRNIAERSSDPLLQEAIRSFDEWFESDHEWL